MRKRINSLLFIIYLVAGSSASGARPEPAATAISQLGVMEITSRFVYAQPPVFVNSLPACGNSPVNQFYFCPNDSTDGNCAVPLRFTASTDTST